MSQPFHTPTADISRSHHTPGAPIWLKYKDRQKRRAAEPERKSVHRRSPDRSAVRKRRVDLTLNEQCLRVIQETIKNAERRGFLCANENAPDQLNNLPVENTRLRRWREQRPDTSDADERSIELQVQVQVQAARSAAQVVLPMNEFSPQVIQIVADNRFCIIVGETGSGKTTQVPQILLDEAIGRGVGNAINILCTQPRRIAAISIARRVAAERGETIGRTVGYHVRHEAALPTYGGSITYCTTGILLKQLQSPDEILDGVSHIILDEVHERDINLDFTLVMLKRSFIERASIGKPLPKLILMSATIDTDVFKDYFADPRLGPLAAQCPALHVPGRTFPVQRYYLDDIMHALKETPGQFAPLEGHQISRMLSKSPFKPSNANDSVRSPAPVLLSAIITHVVTTTECGAVLVFLPGLDEITALKTFLMKQKPCNLDFADETKFKVYQLHSLIEEDQRTVFAKSMPDVRKIILSTNIAETSVTIPDVTVVIDSGCIRRMHYDSTRRISELRTVFVSQSNLNQRAGRAGRVRPGSYYGLFHKDHIKALSPLPVPEMRLADLADLGLTIRAQQNPVPIAEFLADAVEPPLQKAVDAAVSDLTGLGAIAENETITNLGRVLAKLPLHPALGKLIVLGILFECLDPIIILGTAAESSVWERGTLETEGSANAMRFHFTEGTFSEHLALLHAYRDLRAAVEQDPSLDTSAWCRRHFLRPPAMQHVDQGARQVEEILAETGLIPKPPAHHKHLFRGLFGSAHLNANSHNGSLVRAVLAAGLQPNMAWGSRGINGNIKAFNTSHAERLDFAMSWSKMLPLPRIPRALRDQLPLVLFDSSVFTDKSKSTFLSTVTPVSPLIAALFGDDPRGPSNEDEAWMRRHYKYQDQGNLVLGRTNPAGSDERTRRLVMMVRSAKQEAGEADSDEEARDALLHFREGMERTLNRVLRDLARGRAVDQDPEWRLFVNALVSLVEADDWDGLERATVVVQDIKARNDMRENEEQADEW